MVDQRMKTTELSVKHDGETLLFRTFLQCPFYDDTRCLVTYSVFSVPSNSVDPPVFSGGFYVPLRGVEGGIAWDIDAIPAVEGLIEKGLVEREG